MLCSLFSETWLAAVDKEDRYDTNSRMIIPKLSPLLFIWSFTNIYEEIVYTEISDTNTKPTSVWHIWIHRIVTC